MLGYGDQQGVMAYTLNGLYEEIERNKVQKEFIVKVSYLEIYNELVKDLLSSEDNNLELREDPVRGISVAGINEVTASNTNEVLQLLRFSSDFWFNVIFEKNWK